MLLLLYFPCMCYISKTHHLFMINGKRIKFLAHVLLKPGSENFEHYLASM